MNRTINEKVQVWSGWPLIRLFVTLCILTATAHHFLGWGIGLRSLMSLPCRIFGVACFLGLISFTLAEAYLALFFLAPLFAGVLINDALYYGTCWGLKRISGVRSSRLLNGLAFCGSTGLLIVIAYLCRMTPGLDLHRISPP